MFIYDDIAVYLVGNMSSLGKEREIILSPQNYFPFIIP